MSGDELRAEIWRALEADLDVATHAIGDRAVKEALDAYEEVLQARPETSPGRLRIEHFSYAGESDFGRAATLGIVLSVQPNFVLPDEQGVAMEDLRVGSDNSRRVYAWGRLAGLGARLAFGSDYFTTPLPALTTFYSAVSRRNLQGQPATGWHPQERLPRAAALRLLTRSHRAGGNAASGILAVGGQADLVILSGNPLTAAEEEIPAIAVTSTWRQGRQTAMGSPGSGR